MKTHKETNVKHSEVSWHEQGILFDGVLFEQSLLIDKYWQAQCIDCNDIMTWAHHSKRENITQIISHPTLDRLPIPFLNILWDKGVGADLLTLHQAKQQANLMHQDQLAFQWVLLLP